MLKIFGLNSKFHKKLMVSMISKTCSLAKDKLIEMLYYGFYSFQHRIFERMIILAFKRLAIIYMNRWQNRKMNLYKNFLLEYFAL
ncbi:hypothetical protein BpHYR1_039937 [Brachionus plicatilis]|uniref:Uncharacterized protein n=1 Tax=Brachionus plicatilis TaxID=10195 RepID=A0A3M7Q7F7_BRAPC|nr:hypothetical protein BpHYR1_039937 [Brachionus plicatilis]